MSEKNFIVQVTTTEQERGARVRQTAPVRVTCPRHGSHGVELGGGFRRLDLHLGHLELGALQPFAQRQRRRSRCGALQALVVDPVLDGLEPQLQPRRQVLQGGRAEGSWGFKSSTDSVFIVQRDSRRRDILRLLP